VKKVTSYILKKEKEEIGKEGVLSGRCCLLIEWRSDPMIRGAVNKLIRGSVSQAENKTGRL
jgi:hypothetical protein